MMQKVLRTELIRIKALMSLGLSDVQLLIVVRCFASPRNDGHTCFAAKFSTFAPSRSSMISAIHCRWHSL